MNGCRNPFETLYILPNGFTTCCQSWLPPEIPVIGQPYTTPLDAWNHPSFRKLRQSVLAGTYEHCQNCVRYVGGEVPEAVNPDAQPLMTRGPTNIILTNDLVCNLHCWSCRRGPIGRAADEPRRRRIMYEVLDAFHDTIENVQLLQSGEVFASPMHMEWLANLERDQFPKLRCVDLTTNATLLARRWPEITAAHPFVKSMRISVDAATPEVYEVVRRGGKWSDVRTGLALAALLRAWGKLDFLMIAFVVQAQNFRDIPAFVELGQRYGVDLIQFTKLRPWWQSPAEFQAHNVDDPAHPDHEEYLDTLDCSTLRSPQVDARQLIGNLKDLHGRLYQIPK